MSLLMDTETNRFWARVDFLATGEIALHIPEECELPIRVLVSRGGRSTEYEPNSSEKPNICEHITEDGVTCARYPACGDCLDNPLNKLKGSERLVKGSEQTEPTISKMEQVDWKDQMWAEAVEDEPQTDTEIAKAIVHKMIDDAVIAEDAYPDLRQKMHDAVDEYEPQTEYDKYREKIKAHDPHKDWFEDEPQTDCAWGKDV